MLRDVRLTPKYGLRLKNIKKNMWIYQKLKDKNVKN
jgi:hypothetical protein